MATIGEVFDEIVRDAEAGQRTVGENFAQELKYKVSVPVQYVTGPRGGVRVIRSKPGEPPRKETGALQASIQAETIAPADVIQTAIAVDAPYAARLQNELNRPITDGEADAIEQQMLDSLVDAING